MTDMTGSSQQPWASVGGPAAKPQCQCQVQTWSSGFSWERFSHTKKPTTLSVSKILFIMHPFQVYSNLTCCKTYYTSCPKSTCFGGDLRTDLSVWPCMWAPGDTVLRGTNMLVLGLARTRAAIQGADCGCPAPLGRLSLPTPVWWNPWGEAQGECPHWAPRLSHPARVRWGQRVCVLTRDVRSFPRLPALGYIRFASVIPIA